MDFYDNKLVYRCFDCKINHNKDSNNELIDRFLNMYDFCGGDIRKFILLLRKGVYPYGYMDDFDKFNNSEIPSKDAFYSNLNMEGITDIDDRHAKNVFKKFNNNNNLGDYHNLYVQSDTYLLADTFSNFKTFVVIYMN